MDVQTVTSLSAGVVLLTQLVKWSGLPDRYGPISVLFFSLLGVGLWGWSQDKLIQPMALEYVLTWLNVASAAAGVFGFTRASSAAVTAMKAPPAGAGASPTVKMDEKEQPNGPA